MGQEPACAMPIACRVSAPDRGPLNQNFCPCYAVPPGSLLLVPGVLSESDGLCDSLRRVGDFHLPKL